MRKIALTPKADKPSLQAADLKRWRHRCDWTQKQAAAWLNVPLKAYQKWEQAYRAAHNPGPILARMKQARPRTAPDRSQQGTLPLVRRRQT